LAGSRGLRGPFDCLPGPQLVAVAYCCLLFGLLLFLKARGVTLIAASAPTFFIEDTPTAVLVRQVLGAVAEFEKATLVAKLAAARRRKRTATGNRQEGGGA
jgi:DNA invertase Pin-like site-specific DNA recombinase